MGVSLQRVDVAIPAGSGQTKPAQRKWVPEKSMPRTEPDIMRAVARPLRARRLTQKLADKVKSDRFQAYRQEKQLWMWNGPNYNGLVFFLQERRYLLDPKTGLYDQIGIIWKFRTKKLGVNAHTMATVDAKLQQTDQASFNWLGKLGIRKTGLDEAAQIGLVLKRKLRLVGPRPELQSEDEQYSEPGEYRFKYSMKQGLFKCELLYGIVFRDAAHAKEYRMKYISEHGNDVFMQIPQAAIILWNLATRKTKNP